jgi:hypothetical protein
MEKGMAGDLAGATGSGVATPGAPAGLATVARPPTGEASIADSGASDRPKADGKPAGGQPWGSVTVPQDVEDYPGGTLKKDENGTWTYAEGDERPLTWDPEERVWQKGGGGKWFGPPPEELGAQMAERPNLPKEDNA